MLQKCKVNAILKIRFLFIKYLLNFRFRLSIILPYNYMYFVYNYFTIHMLTKAKILEIAAARGKVVTSDIVAAFKISRQN